MGQGYDSEYAVPFDLSFLAGFLRMGWALCLKPIVDMGAILVPAC